MLKIPLYLCEFPSPGKERDQLVHMEVGGLLGGSYYFSVVFTLCLDGPGF